MEKQKVANAILAFKEAQQTAQRALSKAQAHEHQAEAPLNAFRDGELKPAQSAFEKEKESLVMLPVTSMEGLTAKLASLLTSGLSVPQTYKLAEQAQAIYERSDPIVVQSDRYTRLKAEYRKALDNCPTGNLDSPEAVELESAIQELEGRLVTMTPQTPAGMAATMEAYFSMVADDDTPGSASWAETRARPESQLLARLRNGASIIAGLCGD
ncbi:MAG: hypothetical protein AAF340_02850 [Pseudomonadota bacterium]